MRTFTPAPRSSLIRVMSVVCRRGDQRPVDLESARLPFTNAQPAISTRAAVLGACAGRRPGRVKYGVPSWIGSTWHRGSSAAAGPRHPGWPARRGVEHLDHAGCRAARCSPPAKCAESASPPAITELGSRGRDDGARRRRDRDAGIAVQARAEHRPVGWPPVDGHATVAGSGARRGGRGRAGCRASGRRGEVRPANWPGGVAGSAGGNRLGAGQRIAAEPVLEREGEEGRPHRRGGGRSPAPRRRRGRSSVAGVGPRVPGTRTIAPAGRPGSA